MTVNYKRHIRDDRSLPGSTANRGQMKRSWKAGVQDMETGNGCVNIPDDEAKQVVLNLTLNALQAVGENGTIEYRGKQENGFFRLIVRDDGTGIPEENLSKVFDPFFTTKRDGVASGFGLSISFKLVSNAGGNPKIMGGYFKYTGESYEILQLV